MRSLEQQLSRVDLNLLVSLSVLLKERSVSRAAEKLYLSQPAMSRTLGRLRVLFDDPLFYRELKGLQPTEKALALAEQIDSLLIDANSIISSASFNSADCSHNFHLSLPPLMSKMLIIPLMKKMIAQAPKAAVTEYPAASNPMQQLKNRLVDFSIHITPVNNDEFSSTQLDTLYPVIFAHRSHPLAKKSKKVTLKQCLEYQYVDLILDIQSHSEYQNPIDEFFQRQELHRDICYRSGQLDSLTELMRCSDKLLIASHRMMDRGSYQTDFVPVFSFQQYDELNIGIHLIEHRRTRNSPAHQWFKSMIVNTLGSQ
ncbi:HTH-type transcriptional regulator YidZ [Sinobacterium norvegicum]|uniref:HTH-type transcriptional regulator YidZ n=1 Tax=Sinobacterium norvegicum TaxID=1641715 RepID=A0ABN8EG46_9GAMM|nr:LysR family transcriptional regulator [Sinobacterium norvegicum]CAH0991318.1 HTH-type transcriptional regulator YidZ [Sinobacterium norvegicum]